MTPSETPPLFAAFHGVVGRGSTDGIVLVPMVVVEIFQLSNTIDMMDGSSLSLLVSAKLPLKTNAFLV